MSLSDKMKHKTEKVKDRTKESIDDVKDDDQMKVRRAGMPLSTTQDSDHKDDEGKSS